MFSISQLYCKRYERPFKKYLVLNGINDPPPNDMTFNFTKPIFTDFKGFYIL